MTSSADSPEVLFDPKASAWGALLRDAGVAKPHATFLGRAGSEWRQLTRRELGIATDRPVIATGHEAVLWHPGILAKYIALDAWAKHCGAACVHLVVDQHVGVFNSLDVPVRMSDGSLAVETMKLGHAQPDVPMGWHPPLDPPREISSVSPALPSVREGLERIVRLMRECRGQPNAAAQMTAVLEALLRDWISAHPLPGITATLLMTTSLARAMVQAMADDPRSLIEHYNRAIARVPEAGMTALDGAAGELPLWRIDEQRRRQRAFVKDALAWLDDPQKVTLLPRALTMTALLRMGVCDVFIHGIGGARYDPAMEHWIKTWLNAEPQPIVTVSATLRLPLAPEGEQPLDERHEQQRFRHLWHYPVLTEDRSILSDWKNEMLAAINAAPRNSTERRQQYLRMHDRLESERTRHGSAIAVARDRVETAHRQARERAIIERRTWPFPFYPPGMIERLAAEVRNRVQAGCANNHARLPAAVASAARSRAT